jgi:hypothetical protein
MDASLSPCLRPEAHLAMRPEPIKTDRDKIQASTSNQQEFLVLYQAGF